jgi:hypothetical protein
MGWFDCRSRILTLDDARYTIVKRKGGIGYVRTYPFGMPRSPRLLILYLSSSVQTTRIRLSSRSRAGAQHRMPNRNVLKSSRMSARYQACLTRLCSHLLCYRASSRSATRRITSTLLRPNFIVSAIFLGDVGSLFKLSWLEYARLFRERLRHGPCIYGMVLCVGYVHRWTCRWPMRRCSIDEIMHRTKAFAVGALPCLIF